MKKEIKLLIAAFAGAAVLSIPSHAVTILNLGDPRLIGQIAPGTSTSISDNAAYVNSLVDRSHGMLNSSFDFSGQTYLLFNTQGGTLTYANAGGVVTSGTAGGATIGVTGFEYLLLKYNGAKGEDYVFNVAGITGDVQVPATDPRKNSLSSYILFNTATTEQVPVGGSIAIMLGFGLAGMGLLNRRIARK